MQCVCGFRTFSNIEMAKHHHFCTMWKNNTTEGRQSDEPSIPIRHVQPRVMEIDMTQVSDESDVESGDANKRQADIADEMTVLKIMVS